MRSSIYLFCLICLAGLISCQKEIKGDIDAGGGTTGPVIKKPKVGTRWTYRYYTYYSTAAGGGIATQKILDFKAKSEDVLGGEKWLNIVDLATDTTVFLFNEKTGGLYQYADNASTLLCKDPAAINDSYNTFIDGAPSKFTVKGIKQKDTIPTGIGDLAINYYEGTNTGSGSYVIHQVWYNENAWIARKQVYRWYANPGNPTQPDYFRYSTLYLDNIVY